MKEIEVTCGFKVYDENGNLIGFKKDYNGEGSVFKDEDAFNRRPNDICYISEYSCEDEDEGGIIPLSYATQEGETRVTIRRQVKEHLGKRATAKKIDAYTEDVFYLAEWASISTYRMENF